MAAPECILLFQVASCVIISISTAKVDGMQPSAPRNEFASKSSGRRDDGEVPFKGTEESRQQEATVNNWKELAAAKEAIQLSSFYPFGSLPDGYEGKKIIQQIRQTFQLT